MLGVHSPLPPLTPQAAFRIWNGHHEREEDLNFLGKC